MRWAVAMLLMIACKGKPTPPPAPVRSAPAAVDSGPIAAIVYRVLARHYREDDSGVPIENTTTLQIEAGGTIIGPMTFDSAFCSRGEANAKIASSLVCSMGGGTEGVEIRELSSGEYVVASTSTYDEQGAGRDKPRKLGSFRARPGISGDDALVNADGSPFQW